jgi:hypothetical protein
MRPLRKAQAKAGIFRVACAPQGRTKVGGGAEHVGEHHPVGRKRAASGGPVVIVAWALAAFAAAPLLVFALECLVGLRPDRAPAPAGHAPPFTVLVPAHDEAAGIGVVVAAVRRQLRPGDRLLVVADNCSDATAELAVRAGAAVCRRHDPARAGKAFALAHGRAMLRADPPGVVIVLDADCLPEPGALVRLAAGAARGDAVQASNLLRCGPDAGPLVRISTFAFLLRNLIRQRGLRRLSGRALLQGTGMALPWRMFDAAPLATASLAEDLRLGLDLALANYAVRFDEGAAVWSPAASQGATRAQRTRWEHGSLATAAEYMPRLVAAASRGRPGLLVLAADLLVPPLSLLVALVGAVGGALLLLALAGGPAGPLMLLAAAACLFGGALALAWRGYGRTLLPASALLRLPLYLLWKQPIYARLLAGSERRWVRTSRVP